MVLDGTPIRWGQADLIAVALPKPPRQRRLLIRCPSQKQPMPSISELLQGYDTATQITALAPSCWPAWPSVAMGVICRPSSAAIDEPPRAPKAYGRVVGNPAGFRKAPVKRHGGLMGCHS